MPIKLLLKVSYDFKIVSSECQSFYCSACSNDDGGGVDTCVAGDQALLTLNGVFEPDTISAGHVIVRGGQVCICLRCLIRRRRIICDRKDLLGEILRLTLSTYRENFTNHKVRMRSGGRCCATIRFFQPTL